MRRPKFLYACLFGNCVLVGCASNHRGSAEAPLWLGSCLVKKVYWRLKGCGGGRIGLLMYSGLGIWFLIYSDTGAFCSRLV